MSNCYDRAGQPMTMLDWAHAFERPEDKIVQQTAVGDVDVSTVWLGLDHSFGDGPPLIFETMIFGGEHNQWQARYSTEAEANAGHDAAVLWVQGEIPEPA